MSAAPPPAPGHMQPDVITPAGPAWQRLLGRAVLLKPGEAVPLLWAAAYFFCILLSYYLLRPMRDEFGIRGDLSDLPWLWTGTTIAMLVAAPCFAWLVSRFPRRVFLPVTYRFFAANLAIFYALLLLLPESSHKTVGYAFYIWLSVFNLFAISVFWGLMTDMWSPEQSKRLFGAIAVGGTLGAIAGSSVPAFLAKEIGNTSHLLLISVLMLEAAVFCIRRLTRWAAGQNREGVASPEPSASVWAGFVLLARSPYLMAMAVYMLLYTVTSTFLYFEQSRIVKATFTDTAARTAAFAQIDLATNVLTLLMQIFLTGHVVRRLGVIAGLCLVPVISILGFAALWAAPHLGWPIFLTFAIVQVARRSAHYGIDRPSREILYAPLGPDEKYKTKSFIDTFVYRGGDLLGAWANAIKGIAATVEITAIALSGAAVVTAWFLASRNRRILAQREPEPGTSRE